MTPSLATAPPAPLPSIRPAPRHRFPDFGIRDFEQVELAGVVVVRRGPVLRISPGGDAFQQSPPGHSDQFPRHCPQLPQRDLS